MRAFSHGEIKYFEHTNQFGTLFKAWKTVQYKPFESPGCLIVKKKISIDDLNEMLEEKSEFEMSERCNG